MPPKLKIPAPIDRPLSRAYLRQFTGWSTAYPPGLSDPTTTRIMENVQITRKGGLAIRPGLRYLSYVQDTEDSPVFRVVGSQETFFLNDGTKALLCAVTQGGTNDSVMFKVLRYDEPTPSGYAWYDLDDTEIGFEIPQGEDALALSEGTTYVRFLQIDNKIFALGNNGDAVRIFHVGVDKIAEVVTSIDQPNWHVDDKLEVRHPDASWITTTVTTLMRENVVDDPSFEAGLVGWGGTGVTLTRITTDSPPHGTYQGKMVKTFPANTVAYQDIVVTGIKAGKTYELSASLKRGATASRFFLEVIWSKGSGEVLRTDSHRTGELTTTHTRYRTGLYTAPVNSGSTARLRFRFPDSRPAATEVFLDGLMFEKTTEAGKAYFTGATADAGGVDYQWAGTPHASHSLAYEDVPVPVTVPTAETKTTDTLISSDVAENVYNFGFFYTFYNDIGESAPSQVTVVKAQRPWTSWKWETPNGSGEPSGTKTEDPDKCADQLVAFMPEEVFDRAVAQEAKGWYLYMFTWSDQDSVPIEAALVSGKEFDDTPDYDEDGWLRVTPLQDYFFTAPIPNKTTRYNYSAPSHASNGLVAADRIILVNDPTAPAVIRWSSNNQGDYTNFTASRGGGYKTLTSGELMIPGTVKLWQNPQSADTLTILCSGVDGFSTAYYMAPAQVASQADATNIMSFEETTATPGTVSPFGCEVMNNALYHPLDASLMKSTASNYNINHKTVTDMIENSWLDLDDKVDIVSGQLDLRLYLLVHNSNGEALEDGCLGNELWVYDSIAKETGNWSRWTIQGCSLRTVEVAGEVFMSVTRPDGIFYLDPEYALDDYVPDLGETVEVRSIPWRFETNTQGANRAHDAWCHLQQANIVVGSFGGTLRYGIRSHDSNGRDVLVEKLIRRDFDVVDTLPWDFEDYLLIRKDIKEWFFFAESVEEDDVVLPSKGQFSLVQYRYTPISVNIGYEYGSVETFEYGRAGNDATDRNTTNGVPVPFLDEARP